MATIAISNLQPTDSALFLDAESFLNELADEEANLTYGGEAFIRPIPTRPFPTLPLSLNSLNEIIKLLTSK